MDSVARYQIRQQIKHQILEEHLGHHSARVLCESGAVLSEGFTDFLGGIVAKAGGAENLLPKTAVASVKKYFVGKLFKNLGMTRGTPLSEFIENVVVYISLEDITKIASKSITCDEVMDVLLQAATQTVTNLGLMKVLPPLVHYFSQYEFDLSVGSGQPLAKRKKGGKDLKGVSVQEVESMLNTVVGVMGETAISQIVYGLIKDNLLHGMKEVICNLVGISTSGGSESGKQIVSKGKFKHPKPGTEIVDDDSGLRVIDAPPQAPQIGTNKTNSERLGLPDRSAS